ncbi:MAG: polysaccharide pyruvyl transferase family protein [Clostridia bacterium]|nr:polysaccharide pyruvyl transferase family protein [Clostridia bacterium]
MKRYEICIGGYAGCGNLGDDAILQGYLESLPPTVRRRQTVVLSGNPRRDRKRFDVRCVGRKNPFAVWRAFRESKRFLCGGGSLLQNGTGILSLCYYLALLRLARLCGCRTELLASGIGPLHGRAAIRMTVSEIGKCSRIVLRDEESGNRLCDWGIPRERLEYCNDPAGRLQIPPMTRLEQLKNEMRIVGNRAYFCVVVRREKDAGMACLGKISAALQLFVKETDLLPVFLVFDSKEDRAATLQMSQEVRGRVARLREASDALSVISGCRFLVSMRLHALIFAATARIPSIGISPSEGEPKLAAFCAKQKFRHFNPSVLSVGGLLSEMEKKS